MPRPSKIVYKFNSKGKLIATFDSVTDAVNIDQVEYNYLYNRIAKGLPVNDYYYSYDPEFKPPKRARQRIVISAFFDIVAWAKVMKY